MQHYHQTISIMQCRPEFIFHAVTPQLIQNEQREKTPVCWNKEPLFVRIKSFIDPFFPSSSLHPLLIKKLIMLPYSNDKREGTITKKTNEDLLIYSI